MGLLDMLFQPQKPATAVAQPQPMQTPDTGGGILSLLLGADNPAAQWANQNRNWLAATGQGIASGFQAPDWAAASRADQQAAQDKVNATKAEQSKNLTFDFISKNAPDIAAMVQAGLPIAEAWQLYIDRTNPKSGQDASYFGNLVPFQGPDGKIQFGQVSNKGDFRPVALPQGGEFVSPTKTVNTETEQIVMDQFGNVLSRIPIQNKQAAQDTAFGKGIGEAQASGIVAAPKDIAAAQNALDLINQIENSPAIRSATGMTAPLNQILLGTDRFGFEKLVEQAKSGAFLTAIEQMRGLGALSNAEGSAATAAITRMNTSLSYDDFMKALNDYRGIVQQGMQRAQAKLGATGAGGNSGAGWQVLGVE